MVLDGSGAAWETNEGNEGERDEAGSRDGEGEEAERVLDGGEGGGGEGAEVGYGRVGYGMGIGSQAGQQAVKSPGHRVSSASSRGTPHSSYGLCARESCQTNNSQGWSAAFRLVQSSTGAALSRRHRRSDLFSFRLWIPVCDDARRASAVRTAT